MSRPRQPAPDPLAVQKAPDLARRPNPATKPDALPPAACTALQSALRVTRYGPVEARYDFVTCVTTRWGDFV
eukprot:39047-Prymnesium_polylepis.1